MKYPSIIFFFFLALNVHSKTIVNGRIFDKNHELEYFKPFTNFRNFNLSSSIKVDNEGYFKVILDIQNPYFVRFFTNGVTFNLLVEPNDSLYVEITPSKSKKGNNEWFILTGNNSEAQSIYNTDFNFHPSTKFNGVRNLFEHFDENNIQDFFNNFIAEQNKQTNWLDSLLQKKLISETFYEYMSKDIHGIIAYEAVRQAEQYENKDNSTNIIKSAVIEIQKSIFKIYPPTDKVLRFGLYAPLYIADYYRILSKYEAIDSALVICEDQRFLVLASKEEQDYLWGNAIQAVADIDPTFEDLCLASKKYLEKFPNGTFSNYLQENNFCSSTKKIQENIKIYTISETDFFSFLNRFVGKRIMIDIWATWCGPCKLEFKNYTADFYNFLNINKIETVFLSIDETTNQAKWENEVRFFNLKGTHVLSNQSLVESIKDVIFDGNSISIPRYILVDEKGKILLSDAPRPSDPKIRQIFDELLKKK